MKKQKKINFVWIVLLLIFIVGAIFGYVQYKNWRQSFIQAPSFSQEGGIASDPQNYQLDEKTELPLP